MSRPGRRGQAPARYELRIDGHLDDRWTAWFDDLTLTRESDGTTTLRGLVPDQAALHGLLAKVRDLGATLISVEVIDTSSECSNTAPRPPPAEAVTSQPVSERTMSHPIPSTFQRIGAVAGCGTAVILLINAAKRADIIPTSALTQLVAPLAQILALALITALYFAFGRRAGTFGLVAYLLNAFALAALVGVEFVINLVFAELPDHTIETLGPARWASH